MNEMHPTPEDYFATLEQETSPHTNNALLPHGKRPCPICGDLMQVEAVMAMSIDVCALHGVWLDSGKLEAVIRAAQAVPSAERRSLQEAVVRARKESAHQMALIGVCALLGQF